jgi:hypothetical protein
MRQNMTSNAIVFSMFLIFFGAALLSTVMLYTRQSLMVAYILLGVVFLGLSYLGVLNLLSFNCAVIIQNFYNCFKDELLFLFLVIISILYSCFFLINPAIALTGFNMFYKEFCLLFALDLFLPVAGRLYEYISPKDLNFIVPEKKVPILDLVNPDVLAKNLNRI